MFEEDTLYGRIVNLPRWLYMGYVAPPVAQLVRTVRKDLPEEKLLDLERKIYHAFNKDHYFS